MTTITSQLAGTGQLVRLVLRRDRIRLPIWLLGFTGIAAFTVRAATDLYRTPEQIAAYEQTVTGSAAERFMNGRPYDVGTIGGIVANEVTATVQVMTALLVIFLVVRHTRAEEESGRAELLRGTTLGRHAHTASAVIVAAAATVATGVLDAAALIANDFDATGSLLHGAALAAVGLVFTTITAAAAQVSASARTTLGLGLGAFAVLLVLRGAGAVNDTFWTWLSPFGWGQAVQPYGDRGWWPVPAMLGLAAALAALAAYLTANRDEGSGLLPDRPGRPRAKTGLATSFGLALRLQRGMIIGWLVGLTLLAVLFGSFGREMEVLAKENEQFAEMFSAQDDDVLNAFFAYVVVFMGVLTSAFTLASTLRLRSEENAGRTEMLLATRTSRLGWALGGLSVTVLSTLFALVLIGAGTGKTHALATGDESVVPTLIGAMLAEAPAVFLVAATGVLLIGWLPRRAVLAWAVFTFAMLVAYLGGLLQLPDWVARLSPFWHLPPLPSNEFEPMPAVLLTLFAVLAAIAGLAGLRRRDLTGP